MQIDFSKKDLFESGYGDYFAARIVFPVLNLQSQVIGLIGRRLDNQGLRWMKQKSEGGISSKSWLFGIDKAYRHIKHYQTVILVEGIFDYFAFYRLFQDQEKPIVVSTLGSYLTQEALKIFQDLGTKHFIVAYDWDKAGKRGIEKIASRVGGQVHYLGGLKDGQDPHDSLKHVSTYISGFSLKHLLAGAKKSQEKTGKSVHVHFLGMGKPKDQDIVFESATLLPTQKQPEDPEPKEFFYDVDEFMPLLAYNHANRAMLKETLMRIGGLLEKRPTKPQSERTFRLPVGFLQSEGYEDLGPWTDSLASTGHRATNP